MQQPEPVNPLKSQKSLTIQLFRGIAILCVILAHTCPDGIMTVIVRPIVNICVPLCLFLSGYLTKIENRNWPALFKKRIARVFIPYLIWTILYTIQSEDIKRLPYIFLTTGAASHFYYIFVYIQLVLLTPIFGKLAKSKYSYLVWFITPVYLIFYKYIPLLTDVKLGGHAEIICWNLCFGWVAIYYLGLLLGNRIIVKKYSTVFLALFFVISIVLQMGEGYWWLLLGNGNPGSTLKFSSILTAIIFCLLVYVILEQGGFKKCNRFLVLLGDYSFGLYLCHVLVKRLLQMTSLYDSLPYLVNTALVLAISLAICYVGDKLLGARISRWLGFR